jgi:hypothetical protein
MEIMRIRPAPSITEAFRRGDNDVMLPGSAHWMIEMVLPKMPSKAFSSLAFTSYQHAFSL